ncbi:MAG: glycosyltransferase family 25 protein [Devosia sp.]
MAAEKAKQARSGAKPALDVFEVLVARLRAAAHGLPLEERRALWKNVLARFPNEAVIARHYVSDLLVSEGWQELDAFEPQAERYRSAELDLRYIDVALARFDAVRARERLDRFIARYGQSVEMLSRAYDLATMQRDFATALRIAKQLQPLSPKNPDWPRLLIYRARFHRDLKQAWGRPPKGERDYDIFVVNLDRDTLRMDRMARQLGDVAYRRIPAVRGSYLPDLVVGALTHGYGTEMKGTVGCFFSHVAIWEMVASGERSALILEDDAWIVSELPHSLADIPVPDDYELCFVNEGMQPRRFSLNSNRLRVRPAGDVALNKRSSWTAPSTVGYLVSPAGARELLSRIARDGMAGDIDWRLVAYAMTPAQRREIIARGTFASVAIAFHGRFVGRKRPLRAYSLIPSLVRTVGGGSIRIFDNRMAHAHEAAIEDLMAKRRLEKHRGTLRQ